MILVENAEGKEEVVVVEDSTPSEEGEYFDAQPNPAVQVSLNAQWIDSGSDISFIIAKFVVKHNFKLSPAPPLQVAAANGTNMLSETAV